MYVCMYLFIYVYIEHLFASVSMNSGGRLDIYKQNDWDLQNEYSLVWYVLNIYITSDVHIVSQANSTESIVSFRGYYSSAHGTMSDTKSKRTLAVVMTALEESLSACTDSI